MALWAFFVICLLATAFGEEATLSGCVTVGEFHRCTATVSYTGAFNGETLNITRYSTADGNYSPASSVEVVLDTDSVVLAKSIFNHSYPLGKWAAFGSCATSASAAVWDSCYNTYSSSTTSVPAPVVANGYAVNPCGSSIALALPPGSNSTFSPAFCPVNGLKGAIGIQKTATGQLFDAGINSKPGAFSLAATYTIDGVLGTSHFAGTYGTPTVSTASPVSISVTKFPAISAFTYPFWYEADNGTKYVPNAFVMQNYWNYPVDRDWYAYLYNTASGSVDQQMINASVAGIINDRWTRFCQGVMFYCADGVPAGLRSSVLTEDLWDPLPAGFSTSSGQIQTTNSPGAFTATVSFVALFKRLPPAVSLVSYVASRADGYVAVHGINSGNAGSLTLSINYTSGPPGSVSVNIPAGPFDFRVESRAISAICSGGQCIGILYPEENVTPQPANLTPGAKWSDLGATTYSEFVWRLVVIIVAGVGILIVSAFLFVKGRAWWMRRRGYVAASHQHPW